MEDIQKIKDDLVKALNSNDSENFTEILQLSNKLAGLDKENVRFTVDAGVIDRLGKELVARQETAVSELVKNAFDADASISKINFENVNYSGGTLTIEDNGNGMTREQLVNGFMRISSSDKIHFPESPVFKRKRAGKKGIGRFSTQRLGNKLTIFTQTSSSKGALKVTIDWERYSVDEDLFSISNKIEDVPRNLEIVSGTTLVIENLREWWSEAMIKRVYRYALDIIQPFPLSKKILVDNKIQDIGFKILCYKDGNLIADENSMFLEHSVAEIDGYVDKNGKGFWKIPKSKIENTAISTPQLISKSDIKEGVPFDFLEGIKLKAYYFVYNKSLIPKQIESYVKSISNEQAGIRVYRNGFRVLPYGEPQNDWVGLDESVRKRKMLPVHGNNNFFGFIEIDDSNKNFQELSSREGLFNNDAYRELVDFTYKVIVSAVTRISSERGVKITTDQKDWDAKYSRNPREALLDTAKELEELADIIEEVIEVDIVENNNETNEGKTEEQTQKQEDKKAKAEEIRQKAKNIRSAVEHIEEFNMLRVLAGLGLIIGEFTHEIMQYLSAFKIDTNFLIENIQPSTEEYRRALRLQDTFSSFEVYASYFDETISQNVNRELKPIELRDVIRPFVESISPDLKRNNIEIKTEFSGYDLFTCKMHVSEWSSILFNLYSNSKKAINRANRDKGLILINVGQNGNKLYVEFQDNGDGVPTENRDKVFNAFFTTSSPKGNKANLKNELSGTGLGLKILSDVINSYNGEISLENPVDNYITNFRIEIPKATQEEIDEYGL